MTSRNIQDQTLDLFVGREGQMKDRLAIHKAAGSFNQLLQIGGYALRVDLSALEKAVAHLSSGKGISKGALLAHASQILVAAKYDRDDKSEETRTYADAVDRARLLYSGYEVTVNHPSRDWPVKGAMNGAFAVMGETESGKSRYIANTDVELIIRASEPFEQIDTSARSLQVRTYPQAFALVLLCALAEVKCAVDSLRSLVYNLKGGMGEGGVTNAIYELLTTVNNFSAEFGALTIFAINPMVGDVDKSERLYKKIKSSVCGIADIANGSPTKGSFRLDNGKRIDMGTTETGVTFPTFSSEVPGNEHGVDLMVNVDALGGDRPRSQVATQRIGNPDFDEASDANSDRRFPQIDFGKL